MNVQDLANRICTCWHLLGYGTATTTPVENGVEVRLLNEEGEEHYVGNYAEPGLLLHKDVQTVTIGGLEHHVLKVNSVVLPALASHIVGWAVGYDAP